MSMYKKTIAGVSIGVLLIVLLLMKGLQERKFVLFNPVSSAISEEIWNGKNRVERFEFGTLYCNGIPLPTDYIEKTFYVPLDITTGEWETLEFTCPDPELQILFSDDFTKYEKQQVIAEGRDIEFLVYNDTEFSTYHMIFTGLPIISLSTSDGIVNQKEIAGNAVFYDTNFSAQGILASDYHGHVRGNTSTIYPKKGYKLNLTKQKTDGSVENNKLSPFGMRRDDDWILYALYNDESKIRVKLSTDLWNEFGAGELLPNATLNSSLNYVEVVADNAYYGLYALMEPIDAKQLNLSEEDYLYKREHPYELTAEEFQSAKNPKEHVLGFEIKEGPLNENAWLPLADLAEILTAEDEEFTEKIGKVIDEDNAMRLWLYLQVITGFDNREKNVFYTAKKEGENYRFYFAPWDLDLTWGNIAANVEPYYTIFAAERAYTSYIWQPGDRLVRLDVHGAKQKMQQLYGQLRQGILSDEALEERILELNHIVRDSGAYARDQEKWPEGVYAEDCGTILNYAKERLHYLDSALYDLENY